MLRPASLVALAPILTALALLGPAAGATPSKPGFATGVYNARTSQKTTFRFKIVAHTSRNHCGDKARMHCFVALSDPDIYETCSDGTSSNSGLFDVPNGNVSWTGYFSYHQALKGSDPMIDFHAHAWGTKVTGSFREKSPADGSGGALTCDSATVTFTATRA
jgi:hypothetical protein